jgi:hypothetical protein
MHIGCFLSLALMTGSSVVRADHVCTNSPSEVFVGYVPGSNGVAPMPLCRWTEQQEQAPPSSKLVERWEVFDDRFGAISVASNGRYGVSFDQQSREAAEKVAVEQCQLRGGLDCSVGTGLHMNSCTTFAWGGGRYVVDGAPNAEMSEREALEGCEADAGVPCDVIETVCSKPVSRWVYEKPDNWVPAQQ